jgi:hypothetical protein
VSGCFVGIPNIPLKIPPLAFSGLFTKVIFGAGGK